MRVARVDHLVLTVESIERTVAFYADVLGGGAALRGRARPATDDGTETMPSIFRLPCIRWYISRSISTIFSLAEAFPSYFALCSSSPT